MQQASTADSGSRLVHAGRSFRVTVEPEKGGSFVMVSVLDNAGEDLESDVCDTSRSCITSTVDLGLANVIQLMCADIAAAVTAARL